ncbi:MAG: class I adenylate-forming enzyme family protein [Acidobacteriota bacterium]
MNDTLIERLHRACLERGAAVAVRDRERQLTYTQLWNSIVGVAAEIRRRSAAGRPVAIVAPNALEYALGWWGALAAGRTVFELNPLEPAEKNLALLRRIAPGAVISPLDLDWNATIGSAWLSFDALFAAATQRGETVEPALASDSDLACVVFTSGTTGAPKGVMLSHGNLRAVTSAILEYLPLATDDRYALVLPLFHTYGKSVMLTTWFSGGMLIFEHEFHDIHGFVARLSQQRITAFSGVPYHINMLLQRAPLAAHDLSALRWITISGSHCRHDALLELSQRLAPARVFFMYGMTETSTRATAVPPERLPEKPGSCGRPIRGVELRVTTDQGTDAQLGEPGALWIRGPNVMQGYWGEPELTAQTICDGWLRTGDVAHLDHEGFLFLHGRSDDIIKSAGERVSAKEIEEVLERHPDVAEVAVIGVPHDTLGESVTAWIVARHGSIDESSLRSHCAQRLSPHKIPRAFRFAVQLPKTASGKVQKGRLRIGQVEC